MDLTEGAASTALESFNKLNAEENPITEPVVFGAPPENDPAGYDNWVHQSEAVLLNQIGQMIPTLPKGDALATMMVLFSSLSKKAPIVDINRSPEWQHNMARVVQEATTIDINFEDLVQKPDKT
jgi:hypothetical protein